MTNSMNIKNKTFNIVVIGCQMNKSDSERITGYMELYGFKETSREKASIVFIATCGVRQTPEDKIYGLIPEIKKQNKDVIIIITGCLSERKDVQRRLKERVDIWLPIIELPNLINKLSKKFKINNLKHEITNDYLNIKPKYSSKFSAFVPIGNGCNNFCTYCVVPYARGKEIYRNANEILDEIKNLIKLNYKEIILIAQNVNSYESESKSNKMINFAQLLKMVNDIPGNFWIRFSTSHPKDMSDELINTVVECKKVCKHIHLPVQAGDDEILKSMNRGYTVNHYLNLIKKIKNQESRIEKLNYKKNVFQIPISITTDTIVGFPNETEKQFKNTVKLYKKVGYDMSYISQFSPRFGTLAIKMDDNVSRDEKKRREEVLMDIVRKSSFKNNKEYLNKIVKVLIEGVNKKGKLFGKTESFKSIKINKKNYELRIMNYEKIIGRFVDVKIIKIEDLKLYGEII